MFVLFRIYFDCLHTVSALGSEKMAAPEILITTPLTKWMELDFCEAVREKHSAVQKCTDFCSEN